MERTSWSMDALRDCIIESLAHPDFRRASFAGVQRGLPSEWKRVSVRPLELRGVYHLQFSYFDGRKTLVRNGTPEEIGPWVEELLRVRFAGVHLSGADEIDIRTSKRGKVTVHRSPPHAKAVPVRLTHNRIKEVPLPEGRADSVLKVMGILTQDGHVRPTMRPKFTQINEFLKHLLVVIEDAQLNRLGRPIEILDCGCGSSYLTIATHHYLNDVLNLPATVLGVDINEEVIRKSTERAKRLGSDGLGFACETIGEVQQKADVVLALHACDTATDDALAQAIRADAKLVMSVPCCHHDLNRRIKADGDASPLRGILRYGILRERMADLATDGLRAAALRVMGYRTDVVEFVSPEHTARNLLIRAVKVGPVGDSSSVREYLELRQFWQVTPYLERVFGDRFLQLIGATGAPPTALAYPTAVQASVQPEG
ncbi:class I SAM-dependent methyltransferase [Tuwongella immobilis]|uniref:Methyltransferase domain-containing protein n=1 Tax=Tuwongella immobilis TaxID=692036 RepID=A0A6C2YQ73_9BACT|nr:SAM-dependent methyltransferase [Tuwongella immobilis]VIP03544.1 Uncharacterized protein OS=Herpetosiphon aurantiacus (strain ATCC 23779 / DSM 785) GN=Haur_0312 PE=4 SV=1: Methyltransf_32 [Tuwongella immobilis]VTS04456.1 Uncharacterized protein OS=Herpetosiphon aurantiacus (strain ATCC 23779 / DSM 785) GN=Haur_0312 PE=4 SV=1: Methyltransf_32 [Tuwongella immobilis]